MSPKPSQASRPGFFHARPASFCDPFTWPGNNPLSIAPAHEDPDTIARQQYTPGQDPGK